MSALSTFLVFGALMTIAAVVLLTYPLLRNKRASPVTAGAVIAGVPLATLALYFAFSNFDWQSKEPPDSTMTVAQMVAQLENRLREEPDDARGWTMLGRSYVVTGRYTEAVEAYGKARSLTDDTSVEAITGYAEAVALVDDGNIGEEATLLFEKALKLRPDDRKALWYGGVAALERGEPGLARQRWQRLLEFDPPEPMVQLLQEQIALTLQDQPGSQISATEPGSGVGVRVGLAEQFRSRSLSPQTPVFVLARAAGQQGPPVAAVRRTVADLPFEIRLTDADAMIPGRTVSGHDELEIVARIALGGTPTAQPGDLYGRVVSDDNSTVSVTIDTIQ